MMAGRVRRSIPVAMLALAALACGGPAKGPESGMPSGEWRTFEGTGTATGHRQTLQLGPGRKVSIVHLTGSLLLIGEQRLGQGFRNEVIGYTDSLKGGTAWSVWTDSRGDQVFGEFRGGTLGTGSRFTGTLLGGTGRYAGVTGEYEFEWQYVVDEEDGSIQGRITGLKGRFRQDGRTPP
ncbi:MAG TPA: hypothetical protein VF853_11605 [Candidatus Deferrimicrobiaceae bacterium]